MTLANKGTITSAFEHTIRHVSGLEPLWNYMKNKHEWSDHTMESVNWKAHGQSLRRKVKQRTHYYIKLVNGILPTNSDLHMKDSVRCLCPSCHTARKIGLMCCDAPILDAHSCDNTFCVHYTTSVLSNERARSCKSCCSR